MEIHKPLFLLKTLIVYEFVTHSIKLHSNNKIRILKLE